MCSEDSMPRASSFNKEYEMKLLKHVDFVECNFVHIHAYIELSGCFRSADNVLG